MFNIYQDCTGLKGIEIPNSVTTIGNAAFSGCTGLTSIEIPSSVANIGRYAFRDCTGLTSIVIPNSVTKIGDHAFSGCSGLTSVTIPNSVTGIGNNAFEDCDNAVFYVHSDIPALLLLSLSQQGKRIYDIESGGDISSWWYTMTASSVRINNFEPADGYTKVSESFKIGDVEGNYLTGLHPGQQISLTWDIQMKNAEDSILKYSIKARNAYLPDLYLETQVPKVISAGNVIVAAVSNLDDVEEKVGFEWRRTDWTDDFASNTGTAYLFDGMMVHSHTTPSFLVWAAVISHLQTYSA